MKQSIEKWVPHIYTAEILFRTGNGTAHRRHRPARAPWWDTQTPASGERCSHTNPFQSCGKSPGHTETRVHLEIVLVEFVQSIKRSNELLRLGYRTLNSSPRCAEIAEKNERRWAWGDFSTVLIGFIFLHFHFCSHFHKNRFSQIVIRNTR